MIVPQVCECGKIEFDGTAPVCNEVVDCIRKDYHALTQDDCTPVEWLAYRLQGTFVKENTHGHHDHDHD
jgi:hypothetical protein